MIYPLKMVIFHSYVSLPEGTCTQLMPHVVLSISPVKVAGQSELVACTGSSSGHFSKCQRGLEFWRDFRNMFGFVKMVKGVQNMLNGFEWTLNCWRCRFTFFSLLNGTTSAIQPLFLLVTESNTRFLFASIPVAHTIPTYNIYIYIYIRRSYHIPNFVHFWLLIK